MGLFFQCYGVQSADPRKKNIVYDTVPSDELPTRSRSSYSRYVLFTKLTSKRKELLGLLQTFENGGTTHKALDISHLGIAVLYVSKS